MTYSSSANIQNKLCTSDFYITKKSKNILWSTEEIIIKLWENTDWTKKHWVVIHNSLSFELNLIHDGHHS